MRRRTILRTTGAVASSVFASTQYGDVTHGATTTGHDWTTDTSTGGEVEVRSDTELICAVEQCNHALATKQFTDVDGPTTISFDYEVTTDGYWEQTVVEVLENGEPLEPTDASGIDKAFGTTTTGNYEATVDADGPVTLRIGLRPSDHCSNGDHGTTTFRVGSSRCRRTDTDCCRYVPALGDPFRDHRRETTAIRINRS